MPAPVTFRRLFRARAAYRMGTFRDTLALIVGMSNDKLRTEAGRAVMDTVLLISALIAIDGALYIWGIK